MLVNPQIINVSAVADEGVEVHITNLHYDSVSLKPRVTTVVCPDTHLQTYHSLCRMLTPVVFETGGNSWEIKSVVKFTDTIVRNQVLYGSSSPGTSAGWYQTPSFEYHLNDNELWLGISTGGSTWDSAIVATFTPVVNTKYWFITGWDGEQYYIKYSTDGTNYTTLADEASVTPCYENHPPKIQLGGVNGSDNSAHSFEGIMYLSEWYVKIDGTVVWGQE